MNSLASSTAERLISLVDGMASLPYGGERVDQRTHALQCAALAAGGSDELVAAALLHDVGYSAPVRLQFPSRPHEESAALWLRPQLGDGVAALVAAHVSAKRYLVAVHAGYAAGLSSASLTSLAHQGGPADDEEIARWEKLPWWPDAVRLRRCDDAAKVVGGDAPDAQTYHPILLRLAQQRLNGRAGSDPN